MKKVWYLSVEHVPTLMNGDPEGPAVVWAHGKGNSAVAPEEVNEEWLRENAFKTEASAIRTAYRAKEKYKDKYWDVGKVYVVPAETPEEKLHYKIFRCYEIVLLDENDNEVGESNYCYGTRADAEKMAKREVEVTTAMMEEGFTVGY